MSDGMELKCTSAKVKSVGKPTCAGKLKVHLQLNGKGLFEFNIKVAIEFKVERKQIKMKVNI